MSFLFTNKFVPVRNSWNSIVRGFNRTETFHGMVTKKRAFKDRSVMKFKFTFKISSDVLEEKQEYMFKISGVCET